MEAAEESQELETLIRDFIKKSKHLEQLLVIPVWEEEFDPKALEQLVNSEDAPLFAFWGDDELLSGTLEIVFKRLVYILNQLHSAVCERTQSLQEELETLQKDINKVKEDAVPVNLE